MSSLQALCMRDPARAAGARTDSPSTVLTLFGIVEIWARLRDVACSRFDAFSQSANDGNRRPPSRQGHALHPKRQYEVMIDAEQHPKPSRSVVGVRPQACPDTTHCPSAQARVFTFEGAKSDAAFGNLMFAMAGNAVQYAWHNSLVPTVSLSAERVGNTMGTQWASDAMAHSGLWELFFEPYCANVSRWLAACPSTVVRLPLKPTSFWYPGVQVRSEPTASHGRASRIK